MENVKLRELDHGLTLAIYNGGITAFQGSWDVTYTQVGHKDLPVTLKSEIRRVSDVIQLNNQRFIVVGSKEFLPVTVLATRKDGGEVTVDFVFGHPKALEEDDDRWPHVDSLTNTTFALSYEKGSGVYMRIGTWKGEGNTASLELSNEQFATLRFDFHGVAGLDENHFILAVTGNYNQTQGTWPVVGAVLVSIENGIPKLGQWHYLAFTISHNFFDMDNFGRDDVIMVFADAETAGIHGVLIHYDRSTNDISFGSHRVIQNGGAILNYNRIDIRVLSPTTFAVFYEDNAIHRLVLVLCGITNTKDLIVISPKFLVNGGRRGFQPGPSRTWYDICASGWGNFNMIEYREFEDRPGHTRRIALIHRGIVQARLFGIAQKSKKGHLEIQFAGMFNVPRGYSFTPGSAIFANSKGELVEGLPYGYANRDFGSFYEYSRSKQEIYTQSNLVGIAVTKKKIYMKF